MGIITSLYNRNLRIYRTSGVSSSSMFEMGAEQMVLTSTIIGRIGSGAINGAMTLGTTTSAGAGGGQKKKLWCPVTTDIKVGDRIIDDDDTTVRYVVDFVNSDVGGLITHHIECELSSSDFVMVS